MILDPTSSNNSFSTLTITHGRVFLFTSAAISSTATTTIGNGGLLDFPIATNPPGSIAITVQSGGGIDYARRGHDLSNVTLPSPGSVIFNYG